MGYAPLRLLESLGISRTKALQEATRERRLFTNLWTFLNFSFFPPLQFLELSGIIFEAMEISETTKVGLSLLSL